MTRLKIELSYDGTGYLGWQKQTKQEGQTLQGDLEHALFKLTGLKLPTTGSGRTDAGTHAKQQFCHLDFPNHNFEHYDWVRGLNRHLSDQIRVHSVEQTTADFHAVKSALEKTYVYSIQDSPTADPLLSRYSHWVSSPLDLLYLKDISLPLLGRHDFKSFQSVGTDLASTERWLTSLHWYREEHSGLVKLEITGNGFLKQMVRNITGTLLHQYWKKSLTKEQVTEILKAKDRAKAYGTAPAKGLCLERVRYP